MKFNIFQDDVKILLIDNPGINYQTVKFLRINQRLCFFTDA